MRSLTNTPNLSENNWKIKGRAALQIKQYSHSALYENNI
jgi:hypothetical protein